MSDLHRRLYSVAYNFSLPNTGSEVFLSAAYSVFRGKEEREKNESSNNGHFKHFREQRYWRNINLLHCAFLWVTSFTERDLNHWKVPCGKAVPFATAINTHLNCDQQGHPETSLIVTIKSTLLGFCRMHTGCPQRLSEQPWMAQPS